jgi:O-antigen ligase
MTIQLQAMELFSSWNERIHTGGTQAQRYGRILIWLGTGTLMVGMFLTPPVVIGGLGVAFLGALISRLPIHRLTVTWWGIAYTAWLLLSIIIAKSRGQPGAGSIPGSVYGWTALPLVAAAAQDSRWRYFVFRAMVILIIVSSFVALIQFTLGFDALAEKIHLKALKKLDIVEQERQLRARGLNSRNTTFGFILALFAVLASQPISIWKASPSWAWSARILSVLDWQLSGSRAASMAGIAGLITTFLSHGRRWILYGLAIGGILASLTATRMYFNDTRRMNAMLEGKDARIHIWGTAISMASEHPLCGIGGRYAYRQAYHDAFTRTFPEAPYYPQQGGDAHAHNWFLAEIVEHGFPALLLHIALISAIAITCWKKRSTNPSGWRIAIAVIVVGVVGGISEPYPVQSVAGLAFHACLGIGLGLASLKHGMVTIPT